MFTLKIWLIMKLVYPKINYYKNYLIFPVEVNLKPSIPKNALEINVLLLCSIV
jgi:hypothetical protein